MSSANSNAPSVDHLADPVFAVDADGVLRYANDTAADVLGWDATELFGTVVLDLVHPDDLSLAASALQTVQDKAFGDSHAAGSHRARDMALPRAPWHVPLARRRPIPSPV